VTIDGLPLLPHGLSASSLLQLIARARQAILDVYQDANMEVEYKTDKSPLTLADRRSHAILSQGLTELSPSLPILSEEGYQSDWESRKLWDDFWLVDPLDGTRDFVERTDEFTINLALIHQNQPVLGFLDIPVQAVTYVGIAGQGAYRIESEQASRIFSRRSIQGQEVRCAVSRAHSSQEVEWVQAQGMRVSQWIRAGSALKFALVAEGRADLYPRLGPTMEWDTAAGHCLVIAAGGEVCQIDGQPLLYNQENLKNTAFIARG